MKVCTGLPNTIKSGFCSRNAISAWRVEQGAVNSCFGETHVKRVRGDGPECGIDIDDDAREPALQELL